MICSLMTRPLLFGRRLGIASQTPSPDAYRIVMSVQRDAWHGDSGGAGRPPRLVLVLPSTTYRASDFLEAARSVGAEVVVASDGSQAMAETMGAGALTVPVDDPQAAGQRIAAHAATGPIDAVIGVDDRGVRAATVAAEQLGLAHNPLAAVTAAARKDRQRAAFAAAGVPQPAVAVVGGQGEGALPAFGGSSDDVAQAARHVGLPCVLKATTRSASQGVIRADSPKEAAGAAERIRRIVAAAGDDPGQPLVVEAFAPGAEVAVEGVLHGGELEVLAVFDKPDHPDGPTFEETVYVTPSRLPATALAPLETAVAQAAAALGLREGPIHAEARVDVDARRVAMLEVAARSIGGLCSRALRFGAATSLEELLVRHALGLRTDRARRELSASGVLMLPIRQRGWLAGVEGVETARAVPGVEDVALTVTPGQELVPVPEGNRYLGFAFARGATPADVEASLAQVQRALQVRVRAGVASA
jgi:biotin carboxylase